MLLPAEERQELLGDLHERWGAVRATRGPIRAAVWYWNQALGALPRLIRGRFSSVPRRGRLSTTRGWSIWAPGRALRILHREPGFSVTAVTVLALGIGVPTTMYSIEHGIFRPLPVVQPSQVVAVQRSDPRSGRDMGFPAIAVEQLRGAISALRLVAAYRPARIQVDGWEGTATLASGAEVSPALFPLLGIQPILGRGLVEEDAQSAAPDVIVIGERLWREDLGAREDILGRDVRVNGVRRTVVGVMPARFGFPVAGRAWIPLRIEEIATDASAPPVRIIGRLDDGATLSLARAELSALAPSMDDSSVGGAPQPTITAVPFQTTFLGNGVVARAMLVVVCLLLVIAAANVANLLLVRAVRRGKELSVRLALGASRRRIVAEELAQSLLLSGLGAAGGIGLAAIGMAWFRQSFGPSIDVWWVSLRLDASVAVFAAVAAAFVSIAAGITPALQASAVGLQNAMRESSANSFRYARFSRVSVGIQIALSCTMLILVSQIVRGVEHSAVSYDALGAEGVLVVQAHIGDFDYPDAAARGALARDLVGELARVPGVTGAALTNAVPGGSSPELPITIPGTSDSDSPPQAQVRLITATFLRLFGLDVIEGRPMEEPPEPTGAAVRGDAIGPIEALVDERLAQLLAPHGSALGIRVRLPTGGSIGESPSTHATIVGVVRNRGISVDNRGNAQPTIFLSLVTAVPSDVVLLVRGGPNVSVADVRAGVKKVASRLPLTGVNTLPALLEQSRTLERGLAGMFGLFGLVALALGSVGLYAIVAFSVGRRTREIGVRRALGASTWQVMSGSFQSMAPTVAAALIVGTAIAMGLAPAIKPLLWGDGAHERGAFLLVPVILAAIAVVAVGLPGRKAAAVDPMQALRVD